MLNIIENKTINAREFRVISEQENLYKFLNCDFSKCKIEEMNLENMLFENCNMEEISFLNIEIAKCYFLKTNLKKTEFFGCSIDNSIFEICNMANCDFSNSNTHRDSKIYWTKFKDCKMTGVNFNNFRSNKITFENCILRLAYFYGFNFKKQTIIGLDLSEADLCDCNFDEAILENSSLRNVNFKGINTFYNADLRGCDIGGVNSERIKGSFISKAQATELLGKLNIKVI